MIVHSIVCGKDVDQKEWDALASHLGGGYFHCYAQIKFSAARSHAEPLFVKGLNKEGACIGIAACLIEKSRIWPLSRYCNRASFYALPLANNNPETERSLLSVLENHLHQSGVFYIEVASYDSANSESILGSLQYILKTRYEYYFDLHKSLDDLLHRMNSSKRKQLRKAERLGVETKEEFSMQAMEYVQTFHTLSMQRRNIPVRPWNDHDRTITAELLASGRIKILVSYHDREPVNAEMIGIFNHQAYGLVSGSSDQGNKVCGPIHLTWTAIKIFKDEGYSVLSLGGAKEEETGLACYKSELGAISVPMPSGKKIISKFGANLNQLRYLLRR